MTEDKLFQHYGEELISIRRHFHQFPELANEEYETSNFIEKYLQQCGIRVYKGLAKTGVIGVLEGSCDGPIIGIRSDMDALPINEENNHSYRSRNKSKMHACGHDGHMAVTLVTAKILSRIKSRLKGKVVFIFQPAEENLPEGGAKRLLKDGKEILKDLNAIFGFHFWPSLASGEIAVSKKPMMAAGDIFEVTFTGQGAHGGNPHQSSDVLLMTSTAVLTLTSSVLRNIEPGVMATLSVGVVEGGKSPNVLPSEAFIKGTTRYIGNELKEFFPEKIRLVLEGVCQAYNGNYELNYMSGYPVLQNNEEMADIVEKCALEVVGKPKLTGIIKPSLTSEDFAVYLENTPGCYFWIGSNSRDENVINSLHNPKFDLDESVLIIAVKMLLKICQKLMPEPSGY